MQVNHNNPGSLLNFTPPPNYTDSSNFLEVQDPPMSPLPDVKKKQELFDFLKQQQLNLSVLQEARKREESASHDINPLSYSLSASTQPLIQSKPTTSIFDQSPPSFGQSNNNNLLNPQLNSQNSFNQQNNLLLQSNQNAPMLNFNQQNTSLTLSQLNGSPQSSNSAPNSSPSPTPSLNFIQPSEPPKPNHPSYLIPISSLQSNSGNLQDKSNSPKPSSVVPEPIPFSLMNQSQSSPQSSSLQLYSNAPQSAVQAPTNYSPQQQPIDRYTFSSSPSFSNQQPSPSILSSPSPAISQQQSNQNQVANKQFMERFYQFMDNVTTQLNLFDKQLEQLNSNIKTSATKQERTHELLSSRIRELESKIESQKSQPQAQPQPMPVPPPVSVPPQSNFSAPPPSPLRMDFSGQFSPEPSPLINNPNSYPVLSQSALNNSPVSNNPSPNSNNNNDQSKEQCPICFVHLPIEQLHEHIEYEHFKEDKQPRTQPQQIYQQPQQPQQQFSQYQRQNVQPQQPPANSPPNNPNVGSPTQTGFWGRLLGKKPKDEQPTAPAYQTQMQPMQQLQPQLQNPQLQPQTQPGMYPNPTNFYAPGQPMGYPNQNPVAVANPLTRYPQPTQAQQPGATYRPPNNTPNQPGVVYLPPGPAWSNV